jgi:hypothetical protein
MWQALPRLPSSSRPHRSQLGPVDRRKEEAHEQEAEEEAAQRAGEEAAVRVPNPWEPPWGQRRCARLDALSVAGREICRCVSGLSPVAHLGVKPLFPGPGGHDEKVILLRPKTFDREADHNPQSGPCADGNAARTSCAGAACACANALDRMPGRIREGLPGR